MTPTTLEYMKKTFCVSRWGVWWCWRQGHLQVHAETGREALQDSRPGRGRYCHAGGVHCLPPPGGVRLHEGPGGAGTTNCRLCPTNVSGRWIVNGLDLYTVALRVLHSTVDIHLHTQTDLSITHLGSLGSESGPRTLAVRTHVEPKPFFKVWLLCDDL